MAETAIVTREVLATSPSICKSIEVKTRMTYWKEADGRYLGYLNDYPDHWTQGEDLEDLKAHLRDLFEMFSDDDLPGIKREVELELA